MNQLSQMSQFNPNMYGMNYNMQMQPQQQQEEEKKEEKKETPKKYQKSILASKAGSKAKSKIQSHVKSVKQLSNINEQEEQQLEEQEEQQSIPSYQEEFMQEMTIIDKEKLRKRLKIIFMASAFPFFLETERFQIMIKRKKHFQQNAKNILQNASLLATHWALECSKGLLTLFNEKNADLNIFYSVTKTKRPSNAVHQKRAALICKIIDQFFMGLNFVTKQEYDAAIKSKQEFGEYNDEERIALNKQRILKPDLAQFLGSISLNGIYMPDKYLFQFEIDRLEFSQRYGFITNMTPERSKMVLAMFLIVRIFARNVIKNAFHYYKKSAQPQRTPELEFNLRVLSSYIVDIFVQRFIANLRPNPESQKNLELEHIVIPCNIPMPSNGPQYYQNFDSSRKGQQQDPTIPEAIFFDGLIPHQVLSVLYQESPNWTNQMFKNADIFLDLIYRLVKLEYDKSILLISQRINPKALKLTM